MTQKRARSKEAVRQRYEEILDKTSQLILEKEYEEITLVSVAKDLNISRPTIYNYFPSKEDLFLGLLKREYLKAEKNMREHMKKYDTTDAFCRALVKEFYDLPVFIRLLSLHSAALEDKTGYDTMALFKTDTLPFFRTQFDWIRKQFPNAPEPNCWQFLQKITTTSQTFYYYNYIPQDQVEIMAELNTFGSAPLLTAEDYFTNMFVDFARHLE